MSHTDVTDVRNSVQSAGATVGQNTKERAATTLDAVRTQAAAAGETIGSAVSSALDIAKERGRQAQQDARDAALKQAAKSAKKASKSANKANKVRKVAGKRAAKKAHELSILAQEKAGRHPRRKRRRVVVFGLLLATVAVAGTVAQRKKSVASDYPASGAPIADATNDLSGVADSTRNPTD